MQKSKVTDMYVNKKYIIKNLLGYIIKMNDFLQNLRIFTYNDLTYLNIDY
jgi:hypothetical protein